MATVYSYFYGYKETIISLCMCVLDPEPPEEVLETGNGHGGGKKYFEITNVRSIVRFLNWCHVLENRSK